WIGSNILDDLRDLIDRIPVISSPVAPLRAVYAAQVSVLVGPLVPDGYTALLEPSNVCLAVQHPEQFVDDRFEMNLLSRDEWKPLRECEPRLCAEDGKRACSGAVGL